jgi:hypothetical protein
MHQQRRDQASSSAGSFERTARASAARLFALFALFALAGGCGVGPEPTAAAAALSLDDVAEQYVKTALAFRTYDDAYVDAYVGPEEWAAEAEAGSATLEELRIETRDLIRAVELTEPSEDDRLLRQRRALLRKRLDSMLLRMDMADGKRLPFDEESATLFDAVAPDNDAQAFDKVLARIDALLPGDAPLAERVETFRTRFEIPKDRLSAVFDAAIAECRRRTLAHIDLPDDERFTVEYVTDQPWGGYNWYKGDHYSLIQINTDFPTIIDRAVDLGCHEGYPGHHAYNILIEEALVNGRGWIEFALNPLYGPQSLISEGSANYGIDVAFPGDERREFEKAVLFPLAGLDPAEADRFYDLGDALSELGYAGNEAARDYLNGDITADQAVDWLVKYTLSAPAKARQRVRFFDTYRSYVINYNYGRDLVESYVTRRAGDDIAQRWAEFERILSEPITPSDLR